MRGSRIIMELFSDLLSFVLRIDQHLFDLAASHGKWIYLIVFLIVFCETGLVVTPFLPGDSLLFAAGILTGADLASYPYMAAALLSAGILGDSVNYAVGRRVGPAIFNKDTRLVKKEHLIRAHAFYELHGGKAIVLARFIPVIRTFAPFAAGIALMRPGAFLFFNITGCALWVFSLLSAGCFLGNTPFVRENFSLIISAVIVISVMPLAVETIRGLRRKGGGK
jgi:membrane-associated protein